MFTSQTAVEAANGAVLGSPEVTPSAQPRTKIAEQWENYPIFVVGKATAQAGEQYQCIGIL